jgi:hypothetical protein
MSAKSFRVLDVRVAIALVSMLLAAMPAAAADAFRVRLSPVPIDSSTRAETTGIGTATAVLDGTKLTIAGEFRGLAGAATKGELKSGVAKGVRGPSFAQFAVPEGTTGAFKAEVTLTPGQIESLHAGRVYIELASASAPDGNLWGWLLP